MELRILLLNLYCFLAPFTMLGQLPQIYLSDIFDRALTSSKSKISISNVEVISNNLEISLFEYLEKTHKDSDNFKLDSGRIVIPIEIEIKEAFLHRIDLSNFSFQKRFSIKQSTFLETGGYADWLAFTNCQFKQLVMQHNILHDLLVVDCYFQGNVNFKQNNSDAKISFSKTKFAGNSYFHDNYAAKGIEFNRSQFLPTEGLCLTDNDSITYGRELQNNVQFEFHSSFLDQNEPVSLKIYRCRFLTNTPFQKVIISSFNLSNLVLEDNLFQSSLDLNGSAIQNQLIIRNNKLENYIAFNNLIFPELFNIIYWDQLEGYKISVYEDLPGEYECNGFGFDVPSSVLYRAENRQELSNKYSYEQLINSYQSLFNIYKSRGDLESANGCYFEMKDIVTRRLLFDYENQGTFESYFKWKLNLFLKYFTDYGTKPAKAVEISIYAILGFAVFYFFFPSDWDVLSKNTLFQRINKLIGYFKSDQTLLDMTEQNQKEYSSYAEFKNHLLASKKEIPSSIYLFSQPLYQYSLFFQNAQKSIINKLEFHRGKWSELSPKTKLIAGIIIGLGFLLFLGYVLLIKVLNALTLSVNAFTTLGFGDIPTQGLARYVAIIQGFIGWFLLSIFSVALINQVLA